MATRGLSYGTTNSKFAECVQVTFDQLTNLPRLRIPIPRIEVEEEDGPRAPSDNPAPEVGKSQLCWVEAADFGGADL